MPKFSFKYKNDYSNKLTDNQSKFLDNFINSRKNLIEKKLIPKGLGVKRRCVVCGGTMSGLPYSRKTCDRLSCKGKSNTKITYNPKPYLQISPEELDRQYKQAMEAMKQDKDFSRMRKTAIEVNDSVSH